MQSFQKVYYWNYTFEFYSNPLNLDMLVMLGFRETRDNLENLIKHMVNDLSGSLSENAIKLTRDESK